MVMVNLKGEEISIDGYLQRKLDNIKKIIQRNWDCVILIDGEERSGKSTLGKTIACYLDSNFSVKNISNSIEETKKKIAELPDKNVLLVDEGSLVFSSKDAMLKAQKELLKILDVVGQKNMVLIIVLPSIFDLIKQIAIRRSRFLLHVYADKDMNRGRFLYFGKKKKAKLYELGKKNFGSYKKPKSDFRGRFVKFNPFGKEYDSLKRETLLNTLHKSDDPERSKIYYQRNLAWALMLRKKWITQQKLSEFLKKNGHIIARNSISDAIKGVNVDLSAVI